MHHGSIAEKNSRNEKTFVDIPEYGRFFANMTQI